MTLNAVEPAGADKLATDFGVGLGKVGTVVRLGWHAGNSCKQLREPPDIRLTELGHPCGHVRPGDSMFGQNVSQPLWVESGAFIAEVRGQTTLIAQVKIAKRREIRGDRALRAARTMELMTGETVEPIHRGGQPIVRHIPATPHRHGAQEGNDGGPLPGSDPEVGTPRRRRLGKASSRRIHRPTH